MQPSTALLLALATLSHAQTTTTTLYIPGADTQPLEASIVASDASVTTYILRCIPGTDSSDCGFPGSVTLTEGPKTAAYTFDPEIENGTVLFTGWQQCSLAGTTSAVCIESAGGAEANFPGQSTVTYTESLPYMPVVITARNAAVTTTSSGASSTGLSKGPKTSGSSSTGDLAAQTTFPTNTGTAKTSATSGTSTSTGGVPIVTGNARWAMGGAALAFVML